jgi:prephenate dehydratase
LKKRMERVSFQGEKGAFSQEAAHQLLGPAIEVVPCQRFDDLFRSLETREADAAVVPIENTLHGSVHENYDHLLRFQFPIVAETSVRIVHHLIAPPGIPFRRLRRVYSHPVALNQCLKFLERYPKLERVPFYDTAGSVKMLMQERPQDAAAIASSVATGRTSPGSFCCAVPSRFRRCPKRRPASGNGRPRWSSPRTTCPVRCSAP